MMSRMHAVDSKGSAGPVKRIAGNLSPRTAPDMRAPKAEIRNILRGPTVQAKPAASEPGDESEREADRVAEEVMRMPDESAASLGAVRQRKCAACEDESDPIQAAGLQGQPEVPVRLPIQQRSQPKVALEQAAISEPDQAHERYADEFGGLFERTETGSRDEESRLPDATRTRKEQVSDPGEQHNDTAAMLEHRPAPVQKKDAGQEEDEETFRSLQSSSGQPLPEEVRAKMERAFNVDFSAVRIHEGSQAEAMGALAYTQGTDIHFAPGQYDPASQRGQELLGHELAHVVQQNQGRVQVTSQANGVAINTDPGLEREADVMGAKAARGERVSAFLKRSERQTKHDRSREESVRTNNPADTTVQCQGLNDESTTKGEAQLENGHKPDDRQFKKRAALTFDDGPNKNTEKILNILQKHKIPATFFINGSNVNNRNKRNLLERMIQEGHTVANHTYNHKDLSRSDKKTIKSQVKRTEEIIDRAYKSVQNAKIEKIAQAIVDLANKIARIVGAESDVAQAVIDAANEIERHIIDAAKNSRTPDYTHFFRFPWGKTYKNDGVDEKAIVKSMGYSVVHWDVDSLDWDFNRKGKGHRRGRSSVLVKKGSEHKDNMIGHVVSKAKAKAQKHKGVILLFHDKSYTAKKLDFLIRELKKSGFSFVPLSDQGAFPTLNQ